MLFDHTVAGHRFVAAVSDRDDGDIHPERTAPEVLDLRQRAVAGSRWVMLDQVHGNHIVSADLALQAWPIAATGDGIVTRDQNRPIAVWAADCAPLALFASDGTVGVAHSGWRGLAGGVVQAAVAAVTSNGANVVAAVLGPVIHPCCYEFGERDLAAVAVGVGVDPAWVTGRTRARGRSLDMPKAVAAVLGAHGVGLDVVGPCTGCDDRWFSHRVRAEAERHALVAWREVGTVPDRRCEHGTMNVTR